MIGSSKIIGAAPGGLYPAYRHYSILDPLNEYALGMVGKLHDYGAAKDDAVQTVASYRPSYVAGNYFATDGIDDRLVMGAAPLEETTIMVVKIPTTENKVIYGGYNSASNVRAYFGVNSSGKLSVGVGNQNMDIFNSNTTPPSGWCVVTLQISQEKHTAKMFLNGYPILSDIFTGTKYFGVMWLGALYYPGTQAGTNFSAYQCREFVQLPIIATDAQRIAWENRLKAKWGMT